MKPQRLISVLLDAVDDVNPRQYLSDVPKGLLLEIRSALEKLGWHFVKMERPTEVQFEKSARLSEGRTLLWIYVWQAKLYAYSSVDWAGIDWSPQDEMEQQSGQTVEDFAQAVDNEYSPPPAKELLRDLPPAPEVALKSFFDGDTTTYGLFLDGTVHHYCWSTNEAVEWVMDHGGRWKDGVPELSHIPQQGSRLWPMFVQQNPQHPAVRAAQARNEDVGPDDIRAKDFLQHVNLFYEYHVTVDLPTPEQGYVARIAVVLPPPAGTEPGEEITETAWDEQFFDAVEAAGRPDLIPKDDMTYIVSIQYIGPKNT